MSNTEDNEMHTYIAVYGVYEDGCISHEEEREIECFADEIEEEANALAEEIEEEYTNEHPKRDYWVNLIEIIKEDEADE